MEELGESQVVAVLITRYLDLEKYLVATYHLEFRHTVVGVIMVKTVARVMRYQDRYDPTKSAPFSWVVSQARWVALNELQRRTRRKGVKVDRDVMEDGAWDNNMVGHYVEHSVFSPRVPPTPMDIMLLLEKEEED